MVPKKPIFISHSAEDKALALILSREIERETNGNTNIFVSSRPSAIKSGEDFLDKILNKLDEAAILIILITPSSSNRMWIGFEAGYFWQRTKKEHTHKYPSR